jgi:hypothetical protein
MAQTKRKKRTTKHRGNAAGGIEARGRTGRKLTPEEQKAAGKASARDARMRKPPSWNSAALKSLAMAVVLFAIVKLGVLGGKGTTSTAQALFLAAMAMVLYTPLAYVTDKWVYARQQKSLAQKKA